MKLLEFLESLQIDAESKECMKRSASHMRERLNADGSATSLIMRFGTEEKWLLAAYFREKAFGLLKIADELEE